MKHILTLHSRTIAAKRWLICVNAFDDINTLRQTLLMEQFAESLPVEVHLWLVDRKLKSLDEMACVLFYQYQVFCSLEWFLYDTSVQYGY